ncbi:transcription-repair coupling factor [Tolumonas lignilytica]|uniref:transcription-repair coupling factor n=1 Tax=Tolumonas lignilytica TaxID=1283284 RepID=UPI0004663A2B|nr:transcription-repair coupling factor [Tolumonas lignilytica]
MTNYFTFSLNPKANQRLTFAQLHGSSLSLAIAELVTKQSHPVVLVVNDTPTALYLEQEISFLLQEQNIPVRLFPDWETLPYDTFSPHQDIISQRIETLYHLPRMQQGLLILPVATLMLRTAPSSFIDGYSLLVKPGDKLDLHNLRRRLEHAGYNAVEQVLEHGEYAARGSLLDLFPMGSSQPYRIDFFDDEVDTIRAFDPDTQRSHEPVKEVRLLPAHEFPTDKNAIEGFRQRFRELFDAGRTPDSIYQQVSKGLWPAGIEYYLPLFFEQTSTLLDYLPPASLVMTVGDIQQASEQFWSDVQQRYEDRRYDLSRPLLPPATLYLPVDQLFGILKERTQIHCQSLPVEEKAGRTNLPVHALPELTIEAKQQEPLEALQRFFSLFSGRMLFSVESEGRREALLELLAPLQLQLPILNSFEAFAQGNAQQAIIVSPLEHGFILPEAQIALICENDLFGQKVVQRRRRDKKTSTNNEAIVRNLAELTIGQPVVHLDHGVGRYVGLQTIDAGGVAAEYLTLEYAGADKLYVPVTSLHLISRYSGSENPPLHKLGGEAWLKARKKAVEKIRDVAAELLDVYAKRAARPGLAFMHDKQAYSKFAAGFPFEETPDQLNAINSVLGDMCQAKAMDRLVCGDVGFGKTEVAMRATFVAVHAGKQVAVLVPTTLLAQQHYENFRDRFANWPVNIEVMSRFKSAKEQKAAMEALAEGKIDIIIGTHKLLAEDIRFKDLGLLVVDEEHRFGVRQKEKIKALRADVDILTLTATPIPRTLNMALSGMRDLSVIATPPAKRLAIKTFVRQYDKAVVREAILRELKRGGQVYYLHNNVETIEQTATQLKELLPEARIAIAHGQMRERELERVMTDFYHQRYNLLVCTTIIETGIDVPSANTIIMDRADNLGLAQLHQLRGRVGRSHHQAYAYLLTPHPKQMTKDAIKRLEAIESLEDLGAGFVLATHDLEIRGAGELLGDEQSGQIESIGFTLYMEMLEQAVNALKEGKEPSLDQLLANHTDIELRVPALLPDEYIPDVNMRLSMYKRIASCNSQEEIDELKIELIDRFGLLPQSAQNLIQISRFRLLAKPLGLKRIEIGDRGGYIDFTQETKINPMFIVSLIQNQPRLYRMDGPTRLRFNLPSDDVKTRFTLVEQILTSFTQNQL